MMRWRWAALAAAVALFALYAFAAATWSDDASAPRALQVFRPIGYGFYQWCCIVAALGFARHWNPKDSSLRRYLTDAIFPYYIVHQTVIVGIAFGLRNLGFPAWLEATIIIAATVASCALSYEIVRRIGWLRPIFGLKWQPAIVRRTADVAT